MTPDNKYESTPTQSNFKKLGEKPTVNEIVNAFNSLSKKVEDHDKIIENHSQRLVSLESVTKDWKAITKALTSMSYNGQWDIMYDKFALSYRLEAQWKKTGNPLWKMMDIFFDSISSLPEKDKFQTLKWFFAEYKTNVEDKQYDKAFRKIFQKEAKSETFTKFYDYYETYKSNMSVEQRKNTILNNNNNTDMEIH